MNQLLNPKQQHGFGAIAAIVVLILMAALAAAIVSLGATQSTTAAQDVLAAKAWQAARAGNEWGLYQIKPTINGNWAGATTPCSTAAQTKTLDLSAATGFNVTITCTPYPYNEGESSPGVPLVIRAYRIVATACPAPAVSCPNNAGAASANYVERTRSVIATE